MRRGLIIVFSCVIALAACVSSPHKKGVAAKAPVVRMTPAPTPAPVAPTLAKPTASALVFPMEHARVISVVSGNSFRARLDNGRECTVRLSAIKAPEKDEYLFWTARKLLRTLLRNKDIMLERDGKDKDKYHRKLRHVFVRGKKGALIYVNGTIVLQGLAHVTLWATNCKYEHLLREQEDKARSAKKRIWSDRAQNVSGSTSS